MEVREKIERAYRKLIKNDGYLLKVDANERSITHRLAIYIEEEFPEWHVDCEYNRDGYAKKRLKSLNETPDSKNEKSDLVLPDIIVHHQGTNNNFVVIEVKKCKTDNELCNFSECKKDIIKLKAYKTDLNYQHAFFMTFPVDNEDKSLSVNDIPHFIEEI